MVSSYGFHSVTDTLNTCSVDVQNIKMLSMCSCFSVMGVLFNLWCSKKKHKLLALVTCYCYVICLMAPFFPNTDSSKLWFHAYSEITFISAKFSVNLINIYKVSSCKTVDHCLALFDALTTKQARALLTSFFYDVILHCRRLTHETVYCLPICGSFGGNLTPKYGQPSFRPQKAHPCLITCVLSHFMSKTNHSSL